MSANLPSVQSAVARANLKMFLQVSFVCNILVLILTLFTEQSLVITAVIAGSTIALAVTNYIVRSTEERIVASIWNNPCELHSNLLNKRMSEYTRWELTVRIPAYYRWLNGMAAVYFVVSIIGTFVLAVCSFDNIPLFSMYYATACAYVVGIPAFAMLVSSNRSAPITT